MEPPDLRGAFPHAIPYPELGTLQDEDFNPGCGYTDPVESAALFRLACAFPGEWIELGSHTGWSGAHIASAGVRLHAVDPMYRTLRFYQRARENWARAGVLPLIVPYAAHSWELNLDETTFAGCFIDGDHEPGMPLQDAQIVLPYMAERCVIVLHDHVGPPTMEAVAWLADQGFRFHVLMTTQQLAICWRGDWEPDEL